MTRHELRLALEGRQRRFDRQMEMLAAHAAWIINHRTPAFGEDPSKRKLVSPKDLYRPQRKWSPEESAKIWREFIRPFKEARGA